MTAPESLLRSALEHGLGGVLTALPGFQRAQREAPELAFALKRHFIHASMLDQLYAEALGKIAEAFAQAEIIGLLIKGAALARTHYREPGHRVRTDADIFVAREHRTAAESCLVKLGMHAPAANSGELVLPERCFEYLAAPGLRLRFDLHWGLSSRPLLARALGFSRLAARAQPVPGLQGWLMPDPGHALLLAAVHRIGHHREHERWIWLYDIHLLWLELRPSEREAAVHEAAQLGLSALLLDALHACMQVLDTPIQASELALLANAARSEPSRHLLDTQQTLLWFDLRNCTWRERIVLLREHALPPREFMVARFGEHARWFSPIFHMRRWWSGLKRG